MKRIALVVFFLVLYPFLAIHAASLLLPQGHLCKSDPVDGFGEAEVTEGLTPEQADQKAKLKAFQDAIEKACPTEISSYTSVLNYRSVVDLVRSIRRGVAMRLMTFPANWRQDGDRVFREVKIQAQFVSLEGNEDPGFDVSFVGMKSSYNEGDEMVVRVNATRDCYVYLFSVAADDSVTVFLPNQYRQDNRLEAGKTLEFPDENDRRTGIRFRMGILPEQKSEHVTEWIMAISLKQPIPFLTASDIREPVGRVYGKDETAQLEELLQIIGKLNLRNADVAYAFYPYEVYRKYSRTRPSSNADR